MIVAYKAFNPDLSCTSGGNKFQYVLGKWNEESEANCAQNGFHCALNPLDCLTYYPDWDKAVYYMVLVDGDIHEDAYDSRISCTRMRLLRQLTLGEFVAESMTYIINHPYLKSNSRILNDEGIVNLHNKFVIVRGKNPIAKGKLGTILGLIKESATGKDIVEAGIYGVEGNKIFPDKWYSVEGKIVEKAVGII